MVKFRGIVFEVDKDGAKCVADIIEGDDRQVVEDHTHARGAVKLSKGINVETMVEELDVSGRPIRDSLSCSQWDKVTGKFKAIEPPVPTFTLATHPRKFLRSRAARLVRLIDLDAPSIVLEGEFRLIEQAMVCLRELEGDKRSVLDDAKLLEANMSEEERIESLREAGISIERV